MRGLSDAQFEVISGRRLGVHQKESDTAAIMLGLEREGLLVRRELPGQTMFDRTRMGWLAWRVEERCRNGNF
jgi:hypothetical protein